jgi:peptide/nickel transport system substrate-binding protein
MARDIDTYWQRLAKQRVSRRFALKGAGLAGAGLGAAALVGCGDEDEAPAPAGSTGTAAPSGGASPTAAATQATVTRGGTIRFPLYGLSSGNPPTIYPYENLTYLAQTISTYHYSRLVRGKTGPDVSPDDQTQIEGDIAQGWQQPDGTTYVFTFKPNVRWHDKAPLNGRPATAGDWVQSYQAFLTTSQNAPGWTQVIDKVEAPDDKTLKVTLKAPFAPFLVTHASSAQGMWFIPVETISNDQAKKDPVGTGPWIFDAFESGVAITGRKNPTFYDAPLPNFDKLESLTLADPQRLVAALLSGDIDMTGLSGSIYKESRSKLDAKGKDFFPQNTSEGAFYFNFDNKPWDDTRVRQALSMALDRDGYLNIQDGTGKGNYFSFIPPGLAPYYLSPRDKNKDYGASGKYFTKNIAEAKALLRAATGSDTLNAKLYANVDRYGTEGRQAWELFASTIKEAGFNVELTFIEYGQYIQSIYLGQIPEGGFACGPLIGGPQDPDDVFTKTYWSKSPRHTWGGTPIKEMPELDAMFEKQRTILDQAERLKYINEIQVKMAESFLVVPYHASAGWVYAQPWLQNFNFRNSYGFASDALMKANFTEERVKKG